MAIYVDANIFVNILLGTERAEEAFYIGLVLIAEKSFRITGAHRIKECIKKNGYGFVKDYVKNLVDLMKDMDIEILEEPRDLKGLSLTCKVHGLSKIATFDSDFDNVDFLEKLP